MKNLYLIFLIFVYQNALAQDTKGLQPIASGASAATGTIHAVIVGVSDYQHKDIPDLKYADKDAKAFATWLQSAAGGSVPAENITLLTNDKATIARFAVSLELLIEQTKEGDMCIIYFSGHGDVESKTAYNYGFLLLHDSPAVAYVAGAYPIFYLQGVVSTLSQDKKAKVLLITDACHAGKLAGSGIGGGQATASALSKQFGNEVKLMSCQPNELSLEGEQWGGGRGVFSFHLVQGLTGLADRNNDATVTLNEIERYLEDKVTNEAAPQPQNPFSVGDKQTKLAIVNSQALAMLQSEKGKESPSIAAIKSKGLENLVFGSQDSVLKKMYTSFSVALDSGFLFEPRGRSANDLYTILIKREELKPLHNIMKINYAVALQDEVQQAINSLLDNDPYESNNWRYNQSKYKLYPQYLAKAIELLGQKHYMYKSLKSKQLYFEGYNIYNNESTPELDQIKREAAKQRAKEKYLEAMTFEPQAAYIHQAIGNMYWYNNPFQTDSLLKYCNKAIELSPTWAAPYLDVSYEYAQRVDTLNAAKYLNKINAILPRNYAVLERLAWLKQAQFKPKESIAICDTMLKLRPDLFNAHSTNSHTLLYLNGDYVNAEKEAIKSLALFNHPNNWARSNLGIIYLKTGRVNKGKACFFDMMIDSTFNSEQNQFALGHLGGSLLALREYGDLQKVVDFYSKTQQLGPTQAKMIEIYRGTLAKEQHNFPKADSIFHYELNLFDYTYGSDFDSYTALGELATLQKKDEAAKKYYTQADSLTSYLDWSSMLFINYGFLKHVSYWQTQNDDSRVAKYLNLLKKHNAFGWETPFAEALMAAKKGNNKECIQKLEKSIAQYLPTFDYITEEPLFDFLKDSKTLKKWKKKGIRNDEK
jgi:protein O-mannosyl-transferase